MDFSTVVAGLLHFLHILATAAWIGGMITNAFVIMPAMQEALTPPEIGKVMSFVMKRFKLVVYLSIILLFASGTAITLTDTNYEGVMVFQNAWSIIMLIKHILVFILAISGLYAFEILAPKVAKLAAEGQSPELASLRKKQMLLAKTGFLLGILVLLCSGLATAIK